MGYFYKHCCWCFCVCIWALSDPYFHSFYKRVLDYNSAVLCRFVLCSLWLLFTRLRKGYVILSEFPLSCLAINGFVAFFVAVEACATELSLLVGAFSGEAFNLAFVGDWGDFIQRLWLLCPHELLVLIPSLDEISNFFYCGILFPCNAEAILDSDWEFVKQKRIDILISSRINSLFCCIFYRFEEIR